MNEITDIARWLYSVLSEVEGAEGVYNSTVPQGADEPYILFQFQGGADQPSFGFGPRLIEATYVVRASAATPSAVALEAIATGIDSALEKASAAATTTDLGLNILGVLREQPFEMVEVVDGVTYRQLGGTYIIHAQGA